MAKKKTSGGVSSVTISSRNKSVTLTADGIKKLGDAIDKSLGVEQPAAPTPDPVTETPEEIYHREVSELQKCVAESALQMAHDKRASKYSEECFKSNVAMLEDRVNRGPENLPLFDGKKSAPTNDAWKDAGIDLLGLPPKVVELLIEEGADTIGGLEELRADISAGKAKWPKGIGPEKITLIENAVIDWLTANRDQFGAVDQSQPVQRAGELAAAGDLENMVETSDQWEAGRRSYGEGIDLRDCPLQPGAKQDAWLKGWLFAERAGK